MIGLLDRDGHVTELTVHRKLSGELDEGADATVMAHLAECPLCQGRFAGVQGVAGAPLPPLRTGGTVVPLRTRWRAPILVGSLLAAAAAALLVLDAPPSVEEPDTFTRRGSELRLEVYRDAPAGAERLLDGAAVRAGDRIGLRVGSAEQGHLVVAGLDGAGAVYPVWPPKGAPGADVTLTPEGTRLDAAVELDATPGTEHLVALRCAEALPWDEVARMLTAVAREPDARLPPLRDGCAQDEVRLVKAPGAP